MRNIKDVDFKRAYGDVPDSFEKRVAYALRQTKEEQPVKKWSVRTIVVVAVLVVAIGAVAYAAINSLVAQRFGEFYGKEYEEKLLTGDIVPMTDTVTLGDVCYTVDEIIYQDGGLYGTGHITHKEGANIVLLPEDYDVNDPMGYAVYTGDQAPADAPSYAETAKQRGAKIILAKCTARYYENEKGEMVETSVGYWPLPQLDGTVTFTFEMTDENIPKADSYKILFMVSNWEVTQEGEHLREAPSDTYQRSDWTVEIKPDQEGKKQ